jgi:hypothetical protein
VHREGGEVFKEKGGEGTEAMMVDVQRERERGCSCWRDYSLAGQSMRKREKWKEGCTHVARLARAGLLSCPTQLARKMVLSTSRLIMMCCWCWRDQGGGFEGIKID